MFSQKKPIRSDKGLTGLEIVGWVLGPAPPLSSAGLPSAGTLAPQWAPGIGAGQRCSEFSGKTLGASS